MKKNQGFWRGSQLTISTACIWCNKKGQLRRRGQASRSNTRGKQTYSSETYRVEALTPAKYLPQQNANLDAQTDPTEQIWFIPPLNSDLQVPPTAAAFSHTMQRIQNICTSVCSLIYLHTKAFCISKELSEMKRILKTSTAEPQTPPWTKASVLPQNSRRNSGNINKTMKKESNLHMPE